jgi:DNA-binding SARP family transcriptional activator/Tfp pilus assembly protein PilF/DNA-binding transcriptional ArsR family regulator
MTAPLTIRLFGSPQILRGEQPLDVTRRKSRMLAFYLAARPGPVQRAQLLSLFWPDLDRTAAQQSLRTTLHGLRRVLDTALVVSDADLAIAPETLVDARRLTAALAEPIVEQRLADALADYRGEFLTELELPDAPDVESWIGAEREHYQRLALRGLGLLAHMRAGRRDYAGAIELLERAAAIDPLGESIQREAMRLEYLSGDRAAAIRRYERFRERLDDELGVPPMAETRAVYDQIVTDSLPAESPDRPRAAALPKPADPILGSGRSGNGSLGRAAAPLPFVGRTSELERLQAHLHGPRLLLIEGEPGIGKSLLADQFMRLSGALGMVGVAHELEQSLPYHPVIDALRSLVDPAGWLGLLGQIGLAPIWRGEIVRLLPEIGPEGPSPSTADESRVWEAVSQLLQGVARRQPTILFLDDLQWADMATIQLLGYLARRTTQVPLTLLAAARPVPPRSSLALLLQTLTREDRLLRLPLTRLSREETHTLALAVSPNFPDPLADWLEQNAEGNPYISVELVRYAQEQHLLGPNGTLAPGNTFAGPVVPHTVESLVLSRLGRISDEARQLLDMAVAAGREFSFEVVAQASALPEPLALDALDELRQARLIEPLSDGRWRFDHSMTMEVAYREAGEPRHRLMHRRIADALATSFRYPPEDLAGTLAWHYIEAGASQQAAPYALIAARRALELAAWQEAITLFEHALVSDDRQLRLAVLMELGEARSHIGAPAAAEAYHEAVEVARAIGDPAAIDAARLALGRELLQHARYADVVDLVQKVRQSGHPGSAVQAELLWGIALSVEGADLCQASEHLLLADQLSDAQANPGTHANIIFELGNVRAQQGDISEAIALYEQSLESAQRDPSAQQQRILAYNNLGYHLHLLGDDRAEEYAQMGLKLAEESGALPFQPYLYSTLGEIALAKGDLDTAERLFADGLALAERITVPERIAGLTANLGLVAIQRGQTTLAVHRLSSALAKADALGLPHLATQIRIWLTPLLPPEEARSTLAAARAAAEISGRKRLLEQIVQMEGA